MDEVNNTSQAAESTPPEMPTPPTESQPEPTRPARAWRILSGLAHRRPVRIAASNPAICWR
jgi:hypothetical protein